MREADDFEAYAADPGRFVDPPTTSPSPTGHSDQLSGYAAVLPSAQEVSYLAFAESLVTEELQRRNRRRIDMNRRKAAFPVDKRLV